MDLTTTQKLPVMDTQAKTGMRFDDEFGTSSGLKNKSQKSTRKLNSKQNKNSNSNKSEESDKCGSKLKVGIKRALSFDDDEEESSKKYVYNQNYDDGNKLVSITSHKQSEIGSRRSQRADSLREASLDKVTGQSFKLRKILTQGPDGREKEGIQKVCSNSQNSYMVSPDVYKGAAALNTFSPNLSPLKHNFLMNQVFFYEEQKDDFDDYYDGFKLRAQKIPQDNKKTQNKWENAGVTNQIQGIAQYDCENKSSSDSQSHDIYQQ